MQEFRLRGPANVWESVFHWPEQNLTPDETLEFREFFKNLF